MVMRIQTEPEAVGKERYTEHQRGWENSQENKSGGRMHGRVYSSNSGQHIQSAFKLHLLGHQVGFCPIPLGPGESFDCLTQQNIPSVMLYSFPGLGIEGPQSSMYFPESSSINPNIIRIYRIREKKSIKAHKAFYPSRKQLTVMPKSAASPLKPTRKPSHVCKS